jgi:hypothetical protein
MKTAERTRHLGLVEISSWQIPDVSPPERHSLPSIRAVLPALQRSSVWKPQQTEKLWDSLLRGFPVGSFLFSAYNEAAETRYGHQNFLLDSPVNGDETHYLLDGQQRATSIALGFYDIWEEKYFDRRKDGPVIWIDLGRAPEKDEREFVLRLVTRSHPWGYQRTNSEARLETRPCGRI